MRIASKLPYIFFICLLAISKSDHLYAVDIEYVSKPRLELGVGIDTLTLETRSDCVRRDANPEGIRQDDGLPRPQQVYYSLEIIGNSSELETALGISAETSIRGAFWHAGGKVAFKERLAVNQYSIYVLATVRIKSGTDSLRDVSLTQDSMELLKKGHIKRFHERCGDEYIVSHTIGGELYSVIEIKTNSNNDRKEIITGLEGSLGVFNASAEIGEGMKNVVRNRKTRIISYTSGGAGIPLPKTVDTMITLASEFPEHVEKIPAITTAHTQSYSLLKLPTDELNHIDITNQKAFMNEISALVHRADQLSSNIIYILSNRQQFHMIEENSLENILYKLARYRTKLRGAISVCYSNHEECKIPDAKFPEHTLPERKEYISTNADEQRLIEKLGREISSDKVDVNGWTDLHFAALLDLPDVAKRLLINNTPHPQIEWKGEFTDDLANLLTEFGYSEDAMKRVGQTPLHIAAQENSSKVIATLLEHNRNTNILDAHKRTPLHYAALANADKAMMTMLSLDQDAAVNAEDKDGETPLHYAAGRGHYQVAELLLKRGAAVNAEDKDGETPLHYAAGRGHYQVAELLLKRGADVNAKDEDLKTPLHYAARRDHYQLAELLLEKGAAVNAKDEDLETPLHHHAARGNETRVAELLLERGAAVNAKDEDLETPLHYAAREGHYQIAELLLEKGADVDAKDGDLRTPLHYVVGEDDSHYQVAQLLLEKRADVNAKDEDLETPLHYAARSNREQIASLLLTFGANVNVKDEDQSTPLHYAARANSLQVAESLILHNADVDAVNFDDLETPLHYAAETNSLQMATLLLNRDANIHARSARGNTPLHYAASKSSQQVSQLLIMRGANVNASNDSRDTPLHRAVGSNALHTTRLLLDNGAMVDAPNDDIETALHIAIDNTIDDTLSLDIVHLLLDNGANVNVMDEEGITPLDIAYCEDPTSNVFIELTDELRDRGAQRNRSCTDY